MAVSFYFRNNFLTVEMTSPKIKNGVVLPDKNAPQ